MDLTQVSDRQSPDRADISFCAGSTRVRTVSTRVTPVSAQKGQAQRAAGRRLSMACAIFRVPRCANLRSHKIKLRGCVWNAQGAQPVIQCQGSTMGVGNSALPVRRTIACGSAAPSSQRRGRFEVLPQCEWRPSAAADNEVKVRLHGPQANMSSRLDMMRARSDPRLTRAIGFVTAANSELPLSLRQRRESKDPPNKLAAEKRTARKSESRRLRGSTLVWRF